MLTGARSNETGVGVSCVFFFCQSKYLEQASGYSENYVCVCMFGEPQEREAGKQALASSTSLLANSAEDERCIDVYVFSVLLRANSTEDERYVYV